MSNKKETAEAVEKEEVTVKAVTEPSFKLEKLREHCLEIFGITSSTFDGATFELDKERQYTKAEIKAQIEAWSKKEVK